MNSESLQAMKSVPDELLSERIETVKLLEEDELSIYEVAKDRETGEHYLHYAYVHRDISGTGEPEFYHHLMPVSHDDVLSYVLGEAPYTYPRHWSNRFLRNGPAGEYVWFDPAAIEDNHKIEQQGEAFRDLLQAYKHKGAFDPQSTAKLLEDIERLYRDDQNGKDGP